MYLFLTGHVSPYRPRAGVVLAVPLLGEPDGERPDTRHVEQQSFPWFFFRLVGCFRHKLRGVNTKQCIIRRRA